MGDSVHDKYRGKRVPKEPHQDTEPSANGFLELSVAISLKRIADIMERNSV
jgi:hypothetical protein